MKLIPILAINSFLTYALKIRIHTLPKAGSMKITAVQTNKDKSLYLLTALLSASAFKDVLASARSKTLFKAKGDIYERIDTEMVH